MSTQFCGCDPEASYLCLKHRHTAAYATLIEPEDELRTLYPHGHPQFLPITLRELKLHSEKNHDYAKGGPPLGNFTRVAAMLEMYPRLSLSDPRVVALVYALKQLDAVLWGPSEQIEHKVEGLDARLQDISVYAKLVMCMNSEEKGSQ